MTLQQKLSISPLINAITVKQKGKLNKSFVLTVLFLILAGNYLNAGSCSGTCPSDSNCISWVMTYETNCTTGEITSFSSTHWNGGWNFTHMNSNTNPEFIGMDAASLGCDPELCTDNSQQ